MERYNKCGYGENDKIPGIEDITQSVEREYIKSWQRVDSLVNKTKKIRSKARKVMKVYKYIVYFSTSEICICS